MRELSIEEKAKAYDEALKVLHKYDGANIMFSQSLKEEMFPELAESEDERIRKALIFHYQGDGCICTNGYIIDYKDIRAWLEKQGEPVDINPSEFDSRLNKLLEQFKSLPEEEIINSLNFYHNVVKNKKL